MRKESKDFSNYLIDIVPFSKKRSHEVMEKESINDQPRTHGAWLSENTISTCHPIIRLHNEILDFCNYVSLNHGEINKRERAIAMYDLKSLC